MLDRIWPLAFILSTLVLTSGCKGSNACEGTSLVCIALTVEGNLGELDQLLIRLDSSREKRPVPTKPQPFTLPVQVAIYPGATSGSQPIVVEAYNGGVLRGFASQNITIPEMGSGSASIVLQPYLVPQVDGGTPDLNKPADLAQAPDLSMPDLAGPLVPLRPAPPSKSEPMYQSVQTRFYTREGICNGRVSAGMSRGAFCYLGADDQVRCAGIVGGKDFGMTFTQVGVGGVKQILLDFSTANALCLVGTNFIAQCMGSGTHNAIKDLSTSFQRYPVADDILFMGTGTWDQLCSITRGRTVFCGGVDYGHPPSKQGSADSFWVNTFGKVQPNDGVVVRPGESRTSCQIRSAGLYCTNGNYGAGTIVNGTEVGGDPTKVCWLNTEGTVGCSFGARFAPGKVLHLAASYYTDSMCAIYNDGSVWCIGSNTNGKLGTGNAIALAGETMVLPPGSALVKCE